LTDTFLAVLAGATPLSLSGKGLGGLGGLGGVGSGPLFPGIGGLGGLGGVGSGPLFPGMGGLGGLGGVGSGPPLTDTFLAALAGATPLSLSGMGGLGGFGGLGGVGSGPLFPGMGGLGGLGGVGSGPSLTVRFLAVFADIAIFFSVIVAALFLGATILSPPGFGLDGVGGVGSGSPRGTGTGFRDGFCEPRTDFAAGVLACFFAIGESTAVTGFFKSDGAGCFRLVAMEILHFRLRGGGRLFF
jgi:hypothetical protein